MVVKMGRKNHKRTPEITETPNGEPHVEEHEGECRCPAGQFWNQPANEPTDLQIAGECLGQYDLGMECGFFSGEVRTRVCKDGLVCRDTTAHDESGTPLNGGYKAAGNEFGRPAKCEMCTQADQDAGLCHTDPAEDHKKNCATTATISGDYCLKTSITQAMCGDHVEGGMAEAHVEASASATAEATATAEIP